MTSPRRDALGRWALRLLWVVVPVLMGLAAEQLIDRASTTLLERSAEATALGYARYVVDVTPRLAETIAERQLGEETRAQLARLSRLGDVFRFKLFDRQGRLVLVSDDLGKRDPITPLAGAQQIGGHHAPSSHLEGIVLGGRNVIELKDGRGKPDRPERYVEAYVPLLREGEVVGVVEVYVDQTATAARFHAAFTQVGAVVAGLLLLGGVLLAVQAWRHLADRQRAAQRMRYLAEHDVLSGALNRASFEQALQHAAWRHEQGGPGFAVMYVDLDRFKEINDALGHKAGDAVLCEVAERLKKLLRHGDLLARLGGDEFALMQSAVRDSADIERLAQRVVKALAQPFNLDHHSLNCTASVGAAQFGSDASTVDELMHKADLAMYGAKSSGRNRFSFYDAATDQRMNERRRLGRDLRDAIGQDAICLHYQPLFDAEGQRLLGYEALMRWTHPERGMVPPSEFIPLAEETGQIEELGAWALQCACRQAALWPEPLSVSVNLSTAQFRSEERLLEVVGSALAASGLAPNRLVLEITESLLLTDSEQALKTVEALAALGCQIAMDDFGTGYSSLAYLWRFPFDKIKIDRAFTQGLGEDGKVALIVRSIVSLAHSMGIRVNAEGVETAGQQARLQQLGCDELQGYLFGRPAPAETLRHEGAIAAQPARPAPPRLADLVTQPLAL